MKTRTHFLAFCVLAFIVSCQQTAPIETSISKKGLIKVTILYPNGEGKTFDMEYYANKHMPMVAELFRDSLKLWEVDKGIAGRSPEEPAPYLAMGYLYFEKLSTFQNAMGVHRDTILNDIPNYTNIQPILQFSEVIE